MNESLKDKVSGSKKAPIVVLFGGSPVMRDQVINNLSILGDITIYGTLSENEGIEKLTHLNGAANVALIGGRYSEEQRTRIKNWVLRNSPNTDVIEAGRNGLHGQKEISNYLKTKLNL